MEIALMKIVESTTVDGPGFRTSIYAAGCSHGCKGCHNPQSWNIDHGERVKIADIMKRLSENSFEQITFTGGDPFFQAEAFAELAKQIKKELHKNIWCYTGYTYEQLLNTAQTNNLLKEIDILVDGRFELQQRNTNLRFRGSENQRFVDVQASLREKRTVLASY